MVDTAENQQANRRWLGALVDAYRDIEAFAAAEDLSIGRAVNVIVNENPEACDMAYRAESLSYAGVYRRVAKAIDDNPTMQLDDLLKLQLN